MQIRHRQQRAQTSKEVKDEYKKYGPRITSQEARQLERSAELYRRAEKIKETERRRKENQKKRKEKEERDRETRIRMGRPDPALKIRASQPFLTNFLQPVGKLEEQQPTKPEDADEEETKVDASDAELENWSQQSLSTSSAKTLKPEAHESVSVHESEVTVCHDSEDEFDDTCIDIGTQTQRAIEEFTPFCAVEEVDANLLDGIEFVTDSQIEREMASDASPSTPTREPRALVTTSEASFLGSLSTQDVELSAEDLDELGVA